jgi:hypothetical protein
MLRIPHWLDNPLIDGGKVVSPTNRPRSTPEKLFFSAAELSEQCGRKNKANWKNWFTSSGAEPATFRLVAQCFNQLRYCVPRKENRAIKNKMQRSKWLTWRLIAWLWHLVCHSVMKTYWCRSLTRYCRVLSYRLSYRELIFYLHLSSYRWLIAAVCNGRWLVGMQRGAEGNKYI